MENTTAESEAPSNPAQVGTYPANTDFVTFNGRLIAVKEIVHARNDTGQLAVSDKPVQGCWIEFRRKGYIFIPGLTVEGLASLIAGNPF